MSLFLVNRYLGEEEDGNTSKLSQSQALLAKLQQKAKQKQKHSLTEQQTCLNEEQTDNQDVKKKEVTVKDKSQEHYQHPKKRKSEVVTFCDFDSNNHDEPVKKQKKKKGTNEESKSSDRVFPVSKTDGQKDKDGNESEEAAKDSPKPGSEDTSLSAGFTVLGGFENKPVQKVHRVLPQWLAEPNVIHKEIKSHLVPISDVPGVCAQMLKNLENNGIHHFFPVQAEIIPAILESAQHGLLIGRGGYRPRDICVSSPTGSGKTFSFVIPVIQVLMERVVCEVRALAVLPTKELAQQVYKVFTSYAEGTALKVVMLAGQRSFAAEQASLSETRGGVRRSAADIVVATPGRLVDHISKNSGLCLQHLRFLIIDEADRMIDSMHQSWLDQVVKAVFSTGGGPEARTVFKRREPEHMTAASLSPPQMPLQKLLFSATLTQNPEKLQQLGLHHPRLFSSIHSPSSNTSADPSQKQNHFDFPQSLTEYYVPCTMSKKPLLILHFILRMKLFPILCFTNSRETAHRLFLLVQLFGGIQAAEFSSRLSPGERKKTLKDFEQGKIQLLISTDAAARGIDINGIKCIINYDAPQYIRTYIHRVGRTARAGKAGLAFTFLLRVQENNFLQMLVEAGRPGIQKQIVKPETLKGMEGRYEQILQELAEVIKDKSTRR
ncbi:ATP-dependent RNA helicase DDX51 isoform X2 [Melanotaenia boesemani]|uniref:ATP-dependent RNA helicase DDX51 isoform X2 n=1 Tax=Melanotaenia boesemani TaxID=1250792 RepID=UPI001C03BB67|nr:ATP-dependent RNA helicase DDX51 isoform X2 [Melanotaenia boesemani]